MPAGIFTAEIIDTPPGGIVSVLRYSANQILVHNDIACDDGDVTTNTMQITGFASKYNFMCLCTYMHQHPYIHVYHCVPFHRSSKCS